jgi:hypothetical protein
VEFDSGIQLLGRLGLSQVDLGGIGDSEFRCSVLTFLSHGHYSLESVGENLLLVFTAVLAQSILLLLSSR